MITAEQRELRKSYIGSSDAAAICGVDPYRSAADVWLEKTGQADGFDGNEHTERGNLLEPVVLDWAEKKLSAALLRDRMKVSECGLLAANFDGMQPAVHVGPLPDGEPFIVEAKTTVNDEEWGDEGTDQVPERHIVQVHHAMYVAGPEWRTAYIAALLPGFRSFDFRMYRVERNDKLADAIAGRGREFMEKFVKSGVRPDDFKPSLEVLKRIRRTPEKTVEVADELVDHYIACKSAAKQADDDVKEAQAALLAALGDAEAGTYARGSITYMEQQRKGYTVEPCAFRQLRIKAAKEKKS